MNQAWNGRHRHTWVGSLWPWGLLAVLWLSGQGWLRAESGDVVVLPQPGKKIKSGWSLEVDYRSVATNGYRPFRIRASLLPMGTAAKADRTLRIEIRPNTWGSRYSKLIGQFLEVPEGATSGSCTILVPQETEVHNFQLLVYEDGEKLEDLSGDFGVTMWGGYGWSEARPGILILDADVPRYDERAAWANQVRSQQQAGTKSTTFPDPRLLALMTNQTGTVIDISDTTHPSDPVLLDSTRTWSRVELMPPRGLPTNWLELSNYDVIFLSLADVRDIIRNQPEAWQALRAWATSGRLLCVQGAGAEFERLEELEQVTGMLPLDRADEMQRRGWSSPSPTAFADEITGLVKAGSQASVVYSMSASPFGGSVSVATAVPAKPSTTTTPEVVTPKLAEQLAKSKFVWRGWGVGAVVAFADENPFPGTQLQWNGMFNTVPPSYWMWYQRHGMSMRRTNAQFWTGWIPGIGKAPVMWFLVLISMFVIVIGPVNYFWLRSRKRTYFMLVTVPAGAAVVSLMLMGYALFSDGLGVRTRLRSFSWIDQRSGQSVTWSRQTYYAGLAPSGGMIFPKDTSVFALEPFPQKNQIDNTRHVVEWSDQGQRLVSGYLASRTMQQFMVVRSGVVEARLELKPSPDGKAPPGATNRLGGSVIGVLVCDDDRNLFWADETADGEALALAPIKLDEAREKLADIIAEHPLEAPAGTEYIERSLPWRYRMYYGNDQDSSTAPPNVHMSILEMQLRNVMSLERLPPRSYVAAVAKTDLVPVGVRKHAESGSLHIVWGQW